MIWNRVIEKNEGKERRGRERLGIEKWRKMRVTTRIEGREGGER